MKVILFDGVCNFCNGTINFILKHDTQGVLKFASQQSEIGQKLLKDHTVTHDLSTIVLIDEDKVYTQSDAVLNISKYLGGAFSILYGLRFLPKFIRDGIYNYIAKNRYQWFGKSDACRIPTPEERSRFLE